MGLLKSKSSVIRTKIMEAVDQKIAEAEARHAEKSAKADEDYLKEIERAKQVRDNVKAISEEEAVNNIVGKLFN